jgi:hypothetical protein
MQYFDRIVQFHKQSKFDKNTFIKKIRGLGFKNKTPDRNNIYVFIKRDADFVIKVSKGVDGLDDVPPENHVLSKFYVYPIYEQGGVRIQPRVKLVSQKVAFDGIQYTSGLSVDELYYYDAGPWNTGWIDKKPVIFDCLP